MIVLVIIEPRAPLPQLCHEVRKMLQVSYARGQTHTLPLGHLGDTKRLHWEEGNHKPCPANRSNLNLNSSTKHRFGKNDSILHLKCLFTNDSAPSPTALDNRLYAVATLSTIVYILQGQWFEGGRGTVIVNFISSGDPAHFVRINPRCRAIERGNWDHPDFVWTRTKAWEMVEKLASIQPVWYRETRRGAFVA